MFTPLFRSSATDDNTYNSLEIVIIPAWGFSQPSQWIDSSGSSWLNELAQSLGPNITISEYTYIERHGVLLSDHILEDGKNFLKSLQKYRPESKAKRPIVFICHGTGGLVLKKALCDCRNFFHQFAYLIPVVSGLIFLGTPHFRASVAEAKTTINLLLKCRNREAGRIYQVENDAPTLFDLCQKFERLNLNAPTFSVYESQETVALPTRLYANVVRKHTGQVVVPQNISRLGIAEEISVDGKSSHIGICNMNSSLFGDIRSFLLDIKRSAPQKIAKANGPYRIPEALQGITLRSDAGTLTIDELLAEQASIPTSYPPGQATGGSTVGSFEFVPSEPMLEAKEKEPILPCFMLSSQNPVRHFVGRADVLTTIDNYLLPGSFTLLNSENEKVLRSFAVCGLGGIGKTSVAVNYAHCRRNVFDAIFWLNADSESILETNFAQISTRLGLEEDSSDLTASRSIAMNWLSKPLKRPSEPETRENLAHWLIIFDNVDNLDILSEFWPGLGQGSVLVTSRDPKAKMNMHIQNGINLSSLSIEDTVQLLQQLTQSPVQVQQKDAIETLANKLGGLPLAINQIAGVFRQLRCSYTGFLRLYDDKGIATVFETQIGQDDGQESRSLGTIWALNRLSNPTRALLQVLCLFDPDEIPEELLLSNSVEQDLPDYPKAEVDYLKARAGLLSSSLISLDEEGKKVSLHRLIQDTVLHQMSEEELNAAYRAAIRLVFAVWPFQSIKDHHSVARFSDCELFFPSVLRLKEGLEPLLQQKIFSPKNLEVARLFNDVGWYMFERGLPEKTESFCNVALSIGEQLKTSLVDDAHKVIRESHSFIGIALVEVNKHSDSMRHKMHWLNMLLERRSGDGAPIQDYELGYAYNEIGVAYGNSGMIEKASDAFRKSIEIFLNLEDYDEIMLGWPEPNLGFMYWLLNDYNNAEQAFIEILDIHAARWGPDDTQSFKTGKILYGLGNVLESQGRFEESLEFHRRCLAQYRKVLGTNHHRFGDICHKMAGHSMRLDKDHEAEKYLDTALRIFQLRGTSLSNEIARTTYLKGLLYNKLKRKEEADELMREAYRIRKNLEPMDSRPLEALRERDFDQLVAFWSR